MKQKLQGLIAGALIGATITGGAVFATTGTKTIEVLYNNIKVYKDNVLCELKDANGTVIEPFIYNGTTYMPVRGTANLAGMDVEWDGNTKSVYLWDELPMDKTYLMECCPPYEYDHTYEEFLAQNGSSFSMGGRKYSNGFHVYGGEGNILFNLNSKYSQITFMVGHIDGSPMTGQTASFFVDGKLIKEVHVDADDLPIEVSIPVNFGLQLKIVTACDEPSISRIGFGNITVQ